MVRGIVFWKTPCRRLDYGEGFVHVESLYQEMVVYFETRYHRCGAMLVEGIRLVS